FDLVLARGAGRLAAYAIAGTREGETTVLEAAARDAASAATLWEAVDALAASRRSARIAIFGQDFGTPLHDSLLMAGFATEPRDDVLSGQVIAHETVYAASRRATGGNCPAFEVWTPAGVTLFGGGEPSLRLEMKEDELHRLLLRRFDLDAALREQRVTVRDGSHAQASRVASVLAPVQWVYQHLDYI
ncbi:MAG TPA: hypothetical protein VFU81_11895, partial [Thermomicrobiales bacterium]|nr:hypothetical protein [Thermomicrobiales bacterium]